MYISRPESSLSATKQLSSNCNRSYKCFIGLHELYNLNFSFRILSDTHSNIHTCVRTLVMRLMPRIHACSICAYMHTDLKLIDVQKTLCVFLRRMSLL